MWRRLAADEPHELIKQLELSEGLSAKRQADLMDAEKSYEDMKRNFAKERDSWNEALKTSEKMNATYRKKLAQGM